MAYEISDWDSKSYIPGYDGSAFPEEASPGATAKNTKCLKAYGLWEQDCDAESAYSDEVAVTVYGSRGKRTY